MSWNEVVSYLASEFGYNLNRKSDWFLGNLKMSQIDSLIDGMNKIRRKEQKTSTPGRIEAGVGDLPKIPGFKVQKRKK